MGRSVEDTQAVGNISEAARHTDAFADALNRRDRDAWIAAFHPECEGYSGLVSMESVEAYRGTEGAGQWFDNLSEVYERVEAKREQTIAVGDHALHLVRVEYVGKASGVALEVLLGMVAEMRDGRYVFLHSHFDLREAFRELAARIPARPTP
jgi:ketosteroid isomerase-like protein